MGGLIDVGLLRPLLAATYYVPSPVQWGLPGVSRLYPGPALEEDGAHTSDR